MTTLNKSKRELLVKEALRRAGFPERMNAIVKEYAAIANDAVDEFVGKFTDAEFEAFELNVFNSVRIEFGSRAPVKYELSFRRDYNVTLNIAGQERTVGFNGYQYELPDESRLRLSQDEVRVYRYTPYKIPVPADHPLRARMDNNDHAVKQWVQDSEGVRLQMLAVLNSVNTVKHLMEVWPECQPLLHVLNVKPEQTVTGTSLALTVADLNKAVGLP